MGADFQTHRKKTRKGNRKKQELENEQTNEREVFSLCLSRASASFHLSTLISLSLARFYFFLRSMSATSSRLALPRECVPSFFFENRSARFSRPVLSSSPIRRS